MSHRVPGLCTGALQNVRRTLFVIESVMQTIVMRAAGRHTAFQLIKLDIPRCNNLLVTGVLQLVPMASVCVSNHCRPSGP